MSLFPLLKRFFIIVREALSGRKKDYFYRWKFDRLEAFYAGPVLDVGTGNGDFAASLIHRGLKVNAIDVVDANRHPELPFSLFDGRRIPFPDKHFQTSLVFFVLHHLDHQTELLEELKRVTSGHILIAEDLVENRFDAVLGNIHLNSSPWAKSNRSFRSHAGWQDFFDRTGLTMAATLRIDRWEYPVYPVIRQLYVLKVP